VYGSALCTILCATLHDTFLPCIADKTGGNVQVLDQRQEATQHVQQQRINKQKLAVASGQKRTDKAFNICTRQQWYTTARPYICSGSCGG
jgi:hypothetical protein